MGSHAELTDNNPVRDIQKMRLTSDGFYTWTLDGVARFEAYHPVGSIPRLALALLLCTRPKEVGWRRPRHTLKGRQIAAEIGRVGLRL
jgi:hypothetical protein